MNQVQLSVNPCRSVKQKHTNHSYAHSWHEQGIYYDHLNQHQNDNSSYRFTSLQLSKSQKSIFTSPNDFIEVTLKMVSLANHQITSDCGWQHCTTSGTNLNYVGSWKKCTSMKNSTLQTIKIYTSSIQYFLRSQWLLSLLGYSPQFYGKCSLLQSSSEWHSRL